MKVSLRQEFRSACTLRDGWVDSNVIKCLLQKKVLQGWYLKVAQGLILLSLALIQARLPEGNACGSPQLISPKPC